MFAVIIINTIPISLDSFSPTPPSADRPLPTPPIALSSCTYLLHLQQIEATAAAAATGPELVTILLLT